MTWFIIKHFICDFLLQTPYQLQNKGRYGHLGGVLHAAIHGAGTFAVCLLLALPGWLGVVDAVAHYHIDWLKSQVNDKWHLSPTNRIVGFWWLFGLDQMLHYLTYVGLLLLPSYF